MLNKWGFLCVKQDMTELIINWQKVPVTLLKFLDQEIVRLKTVEKDWYNAIVIGANKVEKDWKVSYLYTKEFKVDNISDYKVWDKIVTDIINDIKSITIKWVTKGKWFQWVVKRFWFAGWPAAHGSKFHRHPWGIGNRKPRRVNKNHPLPWHMGNENVTLKNVSVIATHNIDWENIVVVKGSVPWSRNSLLRAYIQ